MLEIKERLKKGLNIIETHINETEEAIKIAKRIGIDTLNYELDLDKAKKQAKVLKEILED